MRIPLTAGQSVTIHGWVTPKSTLTWSDVLGDERLTFVFLHNYTHISKEFLHRLQPDIGAWVAAKRVEWSDAPILTNWGAHPIRDLKADLGDLVSTSWGASLMHKVGVTYADLVEAGMTPDSMVLFGYSLNDWITLNFTESDAAGFSAPALGRLFGLTRTGVSRCFIEGEPTLTGGHKKYTIAGLQ